jgi:nucleoside-diphosphate-sugar epimerase
MKILITGGCGYVGSLLVPTLLKTLDCEVLVYDTQWFGKNLSEHPNLTVIKGDIRTIPQDVFSGVHKVIHLANIANDPAVELDPTLSWEVNVLASYRMIESAIKAGVSDFLYASSGSVYGVKEEPNVTEDLDLLPISVYNKTKMIAERVLYSYRDKIRVVCVRPATVCGFADRLRLDVSVNMLTYQALKNEVITVFGGQQVRPNIHIKDLVAVYSHILQNPAIESGFYNAGFENLSITAIAEKIAELTGAKIKITASNDPRSYRQDSTKLLNTGFTPQFGVNDAIDELVAKYQSGDLIEKDSYYTVKTMKSLIKTGDL